MKKERHVKTIPEKFGGNDVSVEAEEFIAANYKNMDAEELFNGLPYAGILRIDVTSEYGDWWYDSNDDNIKAKIVKINEKEGTVDYYHYDSHHRQCTRLRTKYAGYCVRGNVLETLNLKGR